MPDKLVIPTTITYDNNKTAVLEFTETYVLINSVCTIDLSFKGTGLVENSELSFVFTDEVPADKKPLDMRLQVIDNGNKVLFIHYQWYGKGIETRNPYEVSNKSGQIWHIKLSSTSDKTLSRRIVTISIWRLQ
jgi:hypothetical protein